MFVIDSRPKLDRKSFKNIQIGNVFTVPDGNIVYIAIEETSEGYNAINECGALVKFYPTDTVIEVDAELVIK